MPKETTNKSFCLPHNEKICSKINILKTQILHKWGMLFRTLFISSIGIVAYLWLTPEDIGGVPFSELTLNMIINNLFFAFIALGCLYWFFKFPVQEHPEWPNDNPYDSWGWFGILFIFITSVIAFLIVTFMQ